MTLKAKRILYNSILIIFYFSLITIPFYDWNKKNQIHREFTDLSFKIYALLPTSSDTKDESILLYCDSVNIFVKKNPIEIDKVFDCSINNQTENIADNDFISYVMQVGDFYRKKEKTSNRLFFVILLVSQIPLYFARKFIDKKLKEK